MTKPTLTVDVIRPSDAPVLCDIAQGIRASDTTEMRRACDLLTAMYECRKEIMANHVPCCLCGVPILNPIGIAYCLVTSAGKHVGRAACCDHCTDRLPVNVLYERIGTSYSEYLLSQGGRAVHQHEAGHA